jgi:hypothetical protein
MTPEQLLESIDKAYTVLGFIPEDGNYYYEIEEKRYCCGITAACAVTEKGIPKEISSTKFPNDDEIVPAVSERLGLSQDFIKGFIKGFDDIYSEVKSTEFIKGYQFGQKAREKWIDDEED